MTESHKGGNNAEAAGHGFSTAPVFLASISTILGAILFLRFGYAVGHVGLIGAISIVLLSSRSYSMSIVPWSTRNCASPSRKLSRGRTWFTIPSSMALLAPTLSPVSISSTAFLPGMTG